MVEGGVKYHQTKNKKKQFIAWILELFKQLGILKMGKMLDMIFQLIEGAVVAAIVW
jgi:hypothetical protein